MKYSLVTLFLLIIQLGHAQVEYEICIPNSWVGGGTGEISIINTSATAIPAGSTLELNWSGITSIAPFFGFTVSGTGPYILTFTDPIPAGGTVGPFGFNFTNSGAYFPPGTGVFNGNTTVNQVDPPCFVPPSYQNFDCETSFSELCFHPTQTAGSLGEIRLGEGTVHSWNATLDVYVPSNRNSWAISLAVGHAMFTNLVGEEFISINEYFATAVQETNCGCDGGTTDPAWVNNPYPDHENNNPVFCFDYTYGVAVGFFQEEHGTGWLELNQDIPCFIPTFDFDSTIVGKEFETQTIGKVYHDYNNLMFLQYVKCYDIIGFMRDCTDPYGPEKLLAAIYNRGMNAGFIQDILVTNRTAALAAPDLLTFIPGLGQQYAEQISRVTAVLDNNMGAVSTYGTTTYSVPWTAPHSFQGYFDAQISWNDVDQYLEELVPMYAGVGVNMNAVKADVQAVFNGVNGGNPLSYRYQFGPVVDAIVLALPAFEPMSGLGDIYGGAGANSCSFPTGRMEESTVICPGDSALLEVFLTGTGPWTFSYNYNGTSYTVSNVTSSPYVLAVADTGLYYITYIADASGTVGEVICDSVVVSYPNSGSASLALFGGGTCTGDSLEVTLVGAGPWNFEYTNPSGQSITITGVSTSLYYIPGPLTPGNYILNSVSAGSCIIPVNDTITVGSGNIIAFVATPDTITCLQPIVTLDASNSTVGNDVLYQWELSNGAAISSGAGTTTPNVGSAGTYTLIVTDTLTNCADTATIIVAVDTVPPSVQLQPIGNLGCTNQQLTLDASASMPNGLSYNWTTAAGNIIAGAGSPTPTVDQAGDYTLTVVAPNGCAADTTIAIIGTGAFTAAVALTDVSCAQGNDGAATVFVSGGSAPFSYQWSNTTNDSTITGLVAGIYWVIVSDSTGCSDSLSAVINEPSPLNLTLAIASDYNGVPISCAGASDGELEAVITGGTAPYTYAWNNGTSSANVTGLWAGSYSVVVTDSNGCQGIDSIILADPPIVLLQIAGTSNVSCFGLSDGGAAVGANGGVPSYAYSWSNGTNDSLVNNLSAGTYTVNVADQNNCTADTMVVISQPDELLLNVTQTSVTCQNDCDASVNVVVSGGNAPYVTTLNGSLISTSVDSLCAGNYEVVVTDSSNCQIVEVITITESTDNPFANFIPTPDATDYTDTEIAFLDLSNGSIISWDWIFYGPDGGSVLDTSDLQNPSFQYPLIAGSYPVYLQVATTNGCVDDTTLYVQINGVHNFYVPNAFTPNGDGMNDVFIPVGEGVNTNNYQFLIFNRWGEVIFESTETTLGWDGTVGGVGAQQDVYVWKILLQDAFELGTYYEHVGHVTLIR